MRLALVSGGSVCVKHSFSAGWAVCCCCGWERLWDCCVGSLTHRDVGAAKWHTSDELILCQCESSFSHGRGLTKRLWAGVRGRVFFSSPICFFIWFHTRFLLIFSYKGGKKKKVLASGIYQGWNVLRKRVLLNSSLSNTHYETILNWVKCSCFHETAGLYFFAAITPLCSHLLSMDQNLLWISSKCSVTE